MTLKQWVDNRWLKEEATSRDEIANLLAIVDRDMEDAKGPISPDWRFGIAYNAALKLCAVLLRAEGFRAAHGLQHYRTIMTLPLVLGGAGIPGRVLTDRLSGPLPMRKLLVRCVPVVQW